MAVATSPARTAAGRRKAGTATRPPAPARRSAPPRRRSRSSHPAPAARPQKRRRGSITGQFAVVGQAAVAVGRLPDIGLVVRMTHGRLWIPVLGVLLTGIVALNVAALSFSTGSGRTAKQTVALERENSALRTALARRLSNERVQAAAARIGMVVPEPGDIRYLSAGRTDARAAAKRLAATLTTPAQSVAVPVATGQAPAPGAAETTAPGQPPAEQPAPVEPAAEQAPPPQSSPEQAASPAPPPTGAPASPASAGGVAAP